MTTPAATPQPKGPKPRSGGDAIDAEWKIPPVANDPNLPVAAPPTVDHAAIFVFEN